MAAGVPGSKHCLHCEAYEMAGPGLEDVDVCEFHGPFPVSELQHDVELGFSKRGEEARLMQHWDPFEP